MEVEFGKVSYIDSWMTLVRKVSWNFPGLETEEGIIDHRNTVLKFISKNQAICVRENNRVIGVLLFSRYHNMICCLAVADDCRKRGIGSELLTYALARLDRTRPVTVSTFQEGDKNGVAPRALYKKYGFIPGELTLEFGYPNQIFVLYPESLQSTVKTDPKAPEPFPP